MKKWLNSVRYALNGLTWFLRHERNGRLEFVITLITVAMGVWLHISMTEWCLVMLCIALIIAGEMINTSIERVADFMTREQHPEIGLIKDLAAGAVLVLSVIAAMIGLLIFAPKIIAVF